MRRPPTPSRGDIDTLLVFHQMSAERAGLPPTLREFSDRKGLSTHGGYERLSRCVRKGYLTPYEGKKRTTTLTPLGRSVAGLPPLAPGEPGSAGRGLTAADAESLRQLAPGEMFFITPSGERRRTGRPCCANRCRLRARA